MRKFSMVLIASILFSSSVFSFEGAVKVESYEALLQAVRDIHRKAQLIVDQQKVQEMWEIGKRIDEHVMLHDNRGAYGKHVLESLAKDLMMSVTELRYDWEFARTYPEAATPWKLGRSHYEALLAVNDPKKRLEIENQDAQEKWSLDRLRREIQRYKLRNKNPNLVPILPGKVGVYQMVRAEEGPYKNQLVLDLGFSNYFKFGNMGEFKEGDLVFAESVLSEKGLATRFNFKRVLPLESREQLHISTEKNPVYGDASMLRTYPAYVLNVYDGDTFTAIIDLGFGITREQRIRLRRLDAPELEDTDGVAAKAVLEKVLGAHSKVLIQVSKSDDQYGRGLADVWVNDKDISQELLDSGFFTVRES